MIREEAVSDCHAHVGIGVVDQCIEHFHGLPDAHTNPGSALEIHAGLNIESDGLFLCNGPST
jgi:hypothetical protein